MACNGPDTDTDDSGIDLGPALAGVGPNVVLPTLTRFDAEMTSLQTATVAWSDALDAGGDGVAERAAAQEAWASAMAVWQQAELLQIGPGGSTPSVVGALDLRDEVYSWPSVNPCRIDQEVAEGNWDDADFYAANEVNSYGLDAIEYLLWADPDNACPGQVPPNDDGAWDALGPAGVTGARAAFAVQLSTGVLDQNDALIGHWEGDFGVAFATGSDPYASDLEALNAIFDALFYLELTTKDRKLLSEFEAQPSGTSARWIDANLAGFELLFAGADGAGLDDVLRDVGQGELVDSVMSALADARQAAAANDVALESLDPVELAALYEAVKAVTDLLKGDVATTLTLQIPGEAAGDND